MPKAQSDIGLIGLAVMGQNLALNIADHGFQISVYNRTTEKTDKFVAENPNTPGGVVGTKTLEEFARSLAKPRKAVILVQAGKATSSSTAAMRSGPTPSVAKKPCAKKACASSAPAFPAAKKARASAPR